MPPGIVSDETTFATPGYWADGSNVRFRNGRPQTIGGWSRAFSTALSGTCRNALAWIDLDGEQNIAFGTHTHLQVLLAGTLSDITPVGMPAGNIDSALGPGYGVGGYGSGGYGSSSTTEYWARTWSLATFGQNLIASYRGGKVYQWANNPASPAAAVTNAPEINTCMLVMPERNIMVFGTEEETSGDFNSRCIRWSDIDGNITDWTTGSADNAGEYILEGKGAIVKALHFGQFFAIWTTTDVWLGQYIGAPDQTYQFDLVASNCGLAGPNAVTVINQTAYWLTPDQQFYAWTLGSQPGPLPCQILNEFQDNLDPQQIDKVVCCGITQFSEVWWHYPDVRDGDENSRYVAVHLQPAGDGRLPWFRGQLARTAAIDSGPAQYPLMVDTSGYANWHENGQSDNGGVLNWFIKSSDQYLDEAENLFMLRGVWPDFEDQVGPVWLTLYKRMYPQSIETSHGPYSLTVGKEKKDFLAQGRIFSLRFDGTSAPSFMRLGKLSFDVVRTGQN